MRCAVAIGHFILERVFFASLRTLASMVICSRSMRSMAAARASLLLSARAYCMIPSTSLQYLSQTRYLFPLAITSSRTSDSLASSIAFWRAPRSILSAAMRSYRARSLSFLTEIISLYLFLSPMTAVIFSLNSPLSFSRWLKISCLNFSLISLFCSRD